MAVGEKVTPREIGLALAKAIRAEPAVRGLWAVTKRDHVELWLVTEPTDMETTGRLLDASLPLHEQLPNARFLVHVLNARDYPDVDPSTLVPHDAQPIPLHRD